uniref:Uncharacterized protein n=1 Tax=Oryza nivara TaxID=4536 RepID=A0A0E0IHW9_ORYNI
MAHPCTSAAEEPATLPPPTAGRACIPCAMDGRSLRSGCGHHSPTASTRSICSSSIVGIVAAPEPLVHRLHDGVLAVEAPDPSRQHEELVAVVRFLHRATAGDDLEEDDAEAVDAEVPKLGVVGRAEYDVAWLDVAVDDALLPLLLKVAECRAQANDDLVPVDERLA